MYWALLPALVACTGADVDPLDPAHSADVVPKTASATPSVLADLARDPAAFTALVDGGAREGWVALHNNQLREAWASFGSADSDGGARVALHRAHFHASLDRSRRLADARIHQLREERGVVSPEAVTVYEALATCGASPAPTTELDLSAWTRHAGSHESTDAEALTSMLGTPVLTAAADGFEHKFYDPCAHAALARIWQERAGVSTLEAASPRQTDDQWGLGDSLFSPFLSLADARAANAGLDTTPTAAAFGMTPLTGEVSRQDARDQGRALTLAVDTAKAAWLEGGTDQGRALISELGLVERFRQDWLTQRARQFVVAGAPAPGLALLEQAVDVSDTKVGSHNSPLTLALLAETQLATGHTREALDALQRLSGAYPEVLGLQERVGDLAVLEGLGRHGDSKED